jgi:DNA adenine methylase
MKEIINTYPYPGGKRKWLDSIIPYFPKRFDDFRDPFTGGGSLSVYIMLNHPHCRVWINDIYYPVYCFWKQLHDNPNQLIKWLMVYYREYENDLDSLFNHCKETIKGSDELETAGKFWFIQKLSFSGLGDLGSSGSTQLLGFSPKPIINLYDLSQLLKRSKVNITNIDYSECMSDNRNTFTFCDPPYEIERLLYGNKGSTHKDFDHNRFSYTMNQCESPWLITYNDNHNIRQRFSRCYIEPLDVIYTISPTGNNSGSELLISNYDMFTSRTCGTELGDGC